MRGRIPNARGRATIRAIERAALDLAADTAYAEITVLAICGRAGVTERVFFNHFPSKESACLGLDQPEIDHDWARRYVEDLSIPLLTGATGLVRLPPAPQAGERERREAVIAREPALLAAAYAALVPIQTTCRRIVADAVRARAPRLSPTRAELVARVIVAAAAELLDDGGADGRTEVTEALSEVWPYVIRGRPRADLAPSAEPVPADR